jgi:hypothetical protein
VFTEVTPLLTCDAAVHRDHFWSADGCAGRCLRDGWDHPPGHR